MPKKLYDTTVPEPILFEFHTFLLACLSIKRHFSKPTIRTEMRATPATEKVLYNEETYSITLISQFLHIFLIFVKMRVCTIPHHAFKSNLSRREEVTKGQILDAFLCAIFLQFFAQQGANLPI